jgi:hypothetical protein
MISLFLLPPHPAMRWDHVRIMFALHPHWKVPGSGGEQRLATCNTNDVLWAHLRSTVVVQLQGVKFEQQIGSHRICNTNSEP